MWPVPNQHPSSYWGQPHNVQAIASHTIGRPSHLRGRPRLFRGRVFMAPNYVMGSGDLQRNLPQLDADAFHNLMRSAGEIVAQRYPTEPPPRWRNIPAPVAEEMRAEFLGLPRCSEAMRSSINADWTREILILLLARAVNNRRALELRKLRDYCPRPPKIIFEGEVEEGMLD